MYCVTIPYHDFMQYYVYIHGLCSVYPAWFMHKNYPQGKTGTLPRPRLLPHISPKNKKGVVMALVMGGDGGRRGGSGSGLVSVQGQRELTVL
jgi:uncharacterized protein (DUF3820 family)